MESLCVCVYCMCVWVCLTTVAQPSPHQDSLTAVSSLSDSSTDCIWAKILIPRLAAPLVLRFLTPPRLVDMHTVCWHTRTCRYTRLFVVATACGVQQETLATMWNWIWKIQLHNCSTDVTSFSQQTKPLPANLISFCPRTYLLLFMLRVAQWPDAFQRIPLLHFPVLVLVLGDRKVLP